MKTTLEAKVTLRKVSAFAELAMLESRPELQRLCRAAEGDSLTPERIDTVFPGLSQSAHRNLIAHCRYLGLIDQAGRLSTVGRLCLQTGEAPSLEQGVYSFLLAEHPAIGIEILHLKREQPDPFDRNLADLEPVDPLLKDALKPWITVVAPKLKFILRSLPTSKNQPPLGRVTPVAGQCKLQWGLDLATGDSRRWLEGWLEQGEGDSSARLPFHKDLQPLPKEDVRRLFPRWNSCWNAEKGYLAIAYDDRADTQGRDTFRRSYTYPEVEIPSQGKFPKVVVHDVPVGPSSTEVAQDWASRLLLTRALVSERYLTQDQLAEIFADGVRETPLEPFSPAAPAVEAFLSDLKRIDTPAAVNAWWRIAAPLDLSWNP